MYTRKVSIIIAILIGLMISSVGVLITPSAQATLISTTQGNLANQANYLTYSNPQLGFKISYPAEAEYHIEDSNRVIFNIKPNIEASVAILYDKQLGSSVGLQELTSKLLGSLKKTLSNYKFTSSGDSTLGGHPSSRVSYGFDHNKFGPSVAMDEWIVVSDKAYVVHYLAGKGVDVVSWQSITDTMSRSFEIIQGENQEAGGEGQEGGKDPTDVGTLNQKGIDLYKLGRYEEAIENFDKALAIDPQYVNALNNKGEALRELGRLEEAIENFDKALAIDPEYVAALNNKGAVLRELGRNQEAIGNFDKALAIDPEYISALFIKGQVLHELGRNQEAIGNFDKALAIDPNHVYVLHFKGLALAELGRNQEAIGNFDKALAIDPNHVDALFDKGAALAKLGRNQEAIGNYDKALAIDPEDARVLFNKGNALLKLGRNQEAIGNYDKALAIDPEYVKALVNKGAALLKLGRYEESIEYFDKALAIDPDHVNALSNKKTALAKLGSNDQNPGAIGKFNSGEEDGLPNQTNYLNYSSPQFGFKISYPEGAQVIDITEQSQQVIFNIKPNIKVVVIPLLAEQQGLKELTAETLGTLKILRNFFLISSADGTLAGYPSYEVTYGYDDTQLGSVAAVSEWTVVGDKAYMINYNGRVSEGKGLDLASWQSITDTMSRSFEIIQGQNQQRGGEGQQGEFNDQNTEGQAAYDDIQPERIYENPILGLNVSYPSDWSVDETNLRKGQVIFVPKGGETSNTYIYILALKDPPDPDQMEGYVDRLKQLKINESGTIIDEKHDTINGTNTYFFSSTREYLGTPYKDAAIVTRTNNFLYIFRLAGTLEQFDNLKSILDRMFLGAELNDTGSTIKGPSNDRLNIPKSTL